GLRGDQLPILEAHGPGTSRVARSATPRTGDHRGGYGGQRIRLLFGRDAADDAPRGSRGRAGRSGSPSRTGASCRTVAGLRANAGGDRSSSRSLAPRGEPRGPMNVGVVGNPRYTDLAAVLDRVAREAPPRGIKLFTEPRLSPFWPCPVPYL